MMIKIGDCVKYTGSISFLKRKVGKVVCFGPRGMSSGFLGIVFENFYDGHNNFGLAGYTKASGYFVHYTELKHENIVLENK